MTPTKNSLYTIDADKVLEVFFEISSAVHSTNNLDDLYKAIHKFLSRILNVDNFFIAIHNKEKDSISFPYYIDEKDNHPDELLNFSKLRSLTREIILGKKPRFYTKEEIYEFANKKNQHVIGTIAKVWLGVPLMIKEKVIGVIAVQNYTSEEAYQRSDIEILNVASRNIALAIQRKEADDALKTQHQLLEKILESSLVGIALIENRIFKQVNNEIVKLFGYNSKKEIENKSLRMIYASEEDYVKVGQITRSILAKKNRANIEFNLIRKDGTSFPAQIVLICADTKNSSELTIDIMMDISERKNAQTERVKREKLQGVLEIAGAVCHELNQPLQAILGNSELIVMDRSDKKMVNKRLNNIIDQITKMGKIIKKVSSITQYKTVKYVGDVKIFDIWDSDNSS
ncbi:MAG: PAS domain S-box protein [Desulfobacterales bacterium]|nr:PAS domain S-box protein [Desulfobacterales bacterium]